MVETFKKLDALKRKVFTNGNIVIANENSNGEFIVTNKKNKFIGIYYDLKIFVCSCLDISPYVVGYDVRNKDSNCFDIYNPTKDEVNSYVDFVKGNNNFERYPVVINMLKDYLNNEENFKAEDIKEVEKFSYNITLEDKAAIKKEMIGKIDDERFFNMMSIAGSTKSTSKAASADIVRKYLDVWAENKAEFYVLFGNKLSIEAEVDISMDESEMKKEIEKLQMRYPEMACNLDAFKSKELINNKMEFHDLFSRYMPKLFKIGGRVSSFMARLHEDGKFNSDLSVSMQNKKVKGKIVISIDPYDYLTMSTNKHNWDSCHNIIDGCYSTGMVSYMTDESTLIAYRENGENYRYNILGFEFIGNSKYWRQCVYMDKKSCSVIFSRQYPNKSEELSSEVRKLMFKSINDYFGVDAYYQSYNSELPFEYNDISNLGYHDVLHGYDHISSHPENSESLGCVNVGKDAPCVYCGKIMKNSSSRVSCRSCNGDDDDDDDDY